MKRPHLPIRKRSVVLLLLSSSLNIDAVVIPPSRWGHVSVLCGNQLYIHGGQTGVNPMTSPIGSDLYSLDITAAFNSFSVPWVQLTPGPYAAFHSVSLLGPGNGVLAIFGGNTSFASTSSNNDSNSLNLYSTTTGTWMASPLQDPPRRVLHTAVSRLGDGTMFVFGGMVLSNNLLSETTTSELWTVGGYISVNNRSSNTTPSSLTTSTTSITAPMPTGLSADTLGWQKMASPQVGSATDRSSHTATLIQSNGLLVIIGGVSAGALVSMSEILVYDTASGIWSVQTATGATPPLRKNHVAVATRTGQIYIHGGTDIGATAFFADVAILDTTSWTWNQPAIEGTAPTGCYSHAATIVGNNMIMSFGLTAGGATNNIYILDTTTNTWQTSYAPSNLSLTSTIPEDWPGYKPPPISPTAPPTNNGTYPSPPGVESNHRPIIGSIVGGIIGVVALTAILFVTVRRHRQHQIVRNQGKMGDYIGPDFPNQRGYQQEGAYRPTGRVFDGPPASFSQRVEQLWGGLGAAVFWRGDRGTASRSQSQRLEDQDNEESMRSLRTEPITDQDIFLDAVHRARSRVGRPSPVFAPLQQPIGPGSPSSPQSPKLVSAGISSLLGGGEEEYVDVEDATHARRYSDGFENAMLEMDVQMVAVPRGRLYVVNPSDEAFAGQGPGHTEQRNPET